MTFIDACHKIHVLRLYFDIFSYQKWSFACTNSQIVLQIGRMKKYKVLRVLKVYFHKFGFVLGAFTLTVLQKKKVLVMRPHHQNMMRMHQNPNF